jgi:hypothetical protein
MTQGPFSPVITTDTWLPPKDSFSVKGSLIIFPAPLKKGGNYKELVGKSPFAKGGFRVI